MKKGFTLIELLAVIIILGVIFTFIFPKVSGLMGIGKNRDREISESIIMDAAKEYSTNDNTLMNGLINQGDRKCITVQSLIDNGYIKQEDLEKVSINISSKVKIELNSSENLEYTIVDSCTEQTSTFNPPVLTLATETLEAKIDQCGLFRDNHNDLRYNGSNPCNYVYFNCTDNNNPSSSTCEMWRIIGIFNMNGQQRIKLIRKESIGTFSWDTSESTVNNGKGVNEWSQADLMRELNSIGEFADTGYLSTSLSTNASWYNGENNAKGNGNFNKNYVLKKGTQELIDNATWYLGGSAYNLTLAEQYAKERETSHINNPDDGITRTSIWVGKIGLLYPSDYGYASSACYNDSTRTLGYNATTGYNSDICKNSNWLYYAYKWTISPYIDSSYFVHQVNSSGHMAVSAAANASSGYYTNPTLYLKSSVKVRGSGTTSDPYVFTK